MIPGLQASNCFDAQFPGAVWFAPSVLGRGENCERGRTNANREGGCHPFDPSAQPPCGWWDRRPHTRGNAADGATPGCRTQRRWRWGLGTATGRGWGGRRWAWTKFPIRKRRRTGDRRFPSGNPQGRALPHPPPGIPTGFCHEARGCAAEALPRVKAKNINNPNGVVPMVRMGGM